MDQVVSRWFRFYAAAMRNPKVVGLSDKDFRLWVGLMAIASENDGTIPGDDTLKTLLGLRYDHLKSGLSRLISAALIDVIDGGYEPHNWRKHQYKSDTSTERVKKYRSERNVSKALRETAPEAEADTDSIKQPSSVPETARATVPPDRETQPSEFEQRCRSLADLINLIRPIAETDRAQLREWLRDGLHFDWHIVEGAKRVVARIEAKGGAVRSFKYLDGGVREYHAEWLAERQRLTA